MIRAYFEDSLVVTYPQASGVAMATPPTSVAILLMCQEMGVMKAELWGPQQSPPGS